MHELNQEVEQELATRLSRLGSALIDVIIMMLFTLPIAYTLGLFDYIKSGEQPSLITTVLVTTTSIIVFFIINASLLAKNGQTLGKKFNNIKIVTLDGRKPPIHELLLKRYLPYFGFPYIPYIGSIINLVNLCWIFGKETRCLHDVIAGTKVVKT